MIYGVRRKQPKNSTAPKLLVFALLYCHSAAIIVDLAASFFISAALPLPRKYMYTCCRWHNASKDVQVREDSKSNEIASTNAST